MFKDAQIGDRVWDFVYKWGTIIKFNKDKVYKLDVKFDYFDGVFQYTLNGQMVIDEPARLFWDEIKFEIPKRPFDIKSFLKEYIKPIDNTEYNLKAVDHLFFTYRDEYQWVIYHDYHSMDIGKFYFNIIKGEAEDILNTLHQKGVTFENMTVALKSLGWI